MGYITLSVHTHRDTSEGGRYVYCLGYGDTLLKLSTCKMYYVLMYINYMTYKETVWEK